MKREGAGKDTDYKFLTNSWPRLWLIKDDARTFLDVIVLWRLMWNSKNRRAILFTRFGAHEFLENFPSGCTIEVLAGICMNLSKYEPDHVIMRLINCQPNRRWIPRPMTMTSDGVSPINYWLEVNCEVEIVQEGIPV